MVEADNSTHTIPSGGNVGYPWHPWFGRTVAVSEVSANVDRFCVGAVSRRNPMVEA